AGEPLADGKPAPEHIDSGLQATACEKRITGPEAGEGEGMQMPMRVLRRWGGIKDRQLESRNEARLRGLGAAHRQCPTQGFEQRLDRSRMSIGPPDRRALSFDLGGHGDLPSLPRATTWRLLASRKLRKVAKKVPNLPRSHHDRAARSTGPRVSLA